jgi:UDP-galactopyranose mutase
MYNFVIVGAGFFGSICARKLTDAGYKCLVIDKRNHIGGNCYTETRNDINIHVYGPHIFHTSNEEVWKWINKYTSFNNFINSPVANYRGEVYSLPFNMWTFAKLWNISKPDDAKKIIYEQSKHITEPKNLEEQAIALIGTEIYEKLIKGYTEKQWMKSAKELPPEIIKRLPVRFTYDANYYNDKYQGIPIGGYTQIFEKILSGIEVKLNTDFFNVVLPDHENIIYTGPIDRYFNYKYGHLEYKTTKFEHVLLTKENHQGVAVVNYTESSIPYTRIIEHKHFEKSTSNKTWISYEYPCLYVPDETEPYYPVNDRINNEIYDKYKKEADSLTNVYFGGRLGSYKYYDMDKVIEEALLFVNNLKNKL